MAVGTIPGPQYFPTLSTTKKRTDGVVFPKEQRFLSTNARHLSREHEREALGLFSPGPARYMRHDPVAPVVPPQSAPGPSRQAQGLHGMSLRARAATAEDSVGEARR